MARRESYPFESHLERTLIQYRADRRRFLFVARELRKLNPLAQPLVHEQISTKVAVAFAQAVTWRQLLQAGLRARAGVAA